MSSTENIFLLTKTYPTSLQDIWFSHQFPIIFFIIFGILLLKFFWLRNFKINKSKPLLFILDQFIPILFFTSAIFIISFYLTTLITHRHPMNIKEFLIYTPQYNVQYSHMVFSQGIVENTRTDNSPVKKEDFNIIFFPDDIGNSLHEKDFKFDNFDKNALVITYLNTKNLKKIFYNENTFKDHLSSQNITVCSLYFFVNKGTGELAKDDYVSISWMSQTLALGCEGTVNEIVKQILERHPSRSYVPIKTDSSIFNHEYPSNNPESSNDKENNEEEDDHNHNHQKESDNASERNENGFHYSI